MNISLLTNPATLNSDTTALLVLGDKRDITFNVPDNTDLMWTPCKDFYTDLIENERELFCTLDIEVILDFHQLCRDYKDTAIWDPYGLNNSWATMVGLLCDNGSSSIKETFNKCAFDYPTIKPSSLHFIEIFDLALSLDGELIRLTEEYLATGQIITVGNVFHAQWQRQKFLFLL